MSRIVPVGINTNSDYNDFYVYEWVIHDTGEVFYVGKGRGNRAKEHHYNNENAEKIRKENNTDIIIIKDNLTEEEALIIETEEILRIKNETQWVLTNVSTPQGVSNANSPSKTIPKYLFETAPMIYTTDVEEHYFGLTSRKYDDVDLSQIKNVYIDDKMILPDIDKVIFGGRSAHYLEKTTQLLKKCGIKILSTKYAKSVSAWVYCGDLSLWLYEDEQKKAEERIGHRIPAFHLVDVWKELHNKYGEITEAEDLIVINPINNRVDLSLISQFDDYMDTINLGNKELEKGFDYYFHGDYENAIECFDIARSKGCVNPTMFNYYAIMYRKLKDYDNEIDILDEAIFRFQKYNLDILKKHIIDFKTRRLKAIELLNKNK